MYSTYSMYYRSRAQNMLLIHFGIAVVAAAIIIITVVIFLFTKNI